MPDRLDRVETTKDTIQVVVESGASHAGAVASIVTRAVRDVTRELGEFATDVFEIRDAARRAQAGAGDAGPPEDDLGGHGVGDRGPDAVAAHEQGDEQ